MNETVTRLIHRGLVKLSKLLIAAIPQKCSRSLWAVKVTLARLTTESKNKTKTSTLFIQHVVYVGVVQVSCTRFVATD